jgi:hypothetical protein
MEAGGCAGSWSPSGADRSRRPPPSHLPLQLSCAGARRWRAVAGGAASGGSGWDAGAAAPGGVDGVGSAAGGDRGACSPLSWPRGRRGGGGRSVRSRSLSPDRKVMLLDLLAPLSF